MLVYKIIELKIKCIKRDKEKYFKMINDEHLCHYQEI